MLKILAIVGVIAGIGVAGILIYAATLPKQIFASHARSPSTPHPKRYFRSSMT